MMNFYTNKSDIIAWLDEYSINDYRLSPDDTYGFTVEVTGSVDLSNKKLEFIPVKFSEISGDLDCHCNKLTSLEFCPLKVGRTFSCHDNLLTSLKGVPTYIGGEFYCSCNNIFNFQYCPDYVGGTLKNTTGGVHRDRNFSCKDNPNLGELQKVKSFDIIKVEHLKLKAIMDFKNEIEKKLNEVKSLPSKKIIKI